MPIQFNSLRRAIPFAIAFFILFLVTEVKSVQHDDAFDEAVRSAAEQVAPYVVQLRLISSQTIDNRTSSEGLMTTGLLIDEPGWIVSSDFGLPADSDIASSPVAIIVSFADGSKQTAKLVARDYPRRIALLKTLGEVKSVDSNFSINSSVQPGETAIVLGRGYDAEQVNYSVGIVSAIDRLSGRAIQIDANTSASNYGGPLFNLAGKVLGVVTPLGPPGQRGEAWYDSGIGFAVPMAALEKRLATLQSGQDIHAGWAGVQLSKENPFSSVAVIQKTTGPAEEAGIQTGDQVSHVADKPTPTIARFRRELRRYDAGTKLPLTLLRGVEQKKVTLTLIQKPTEFEKPNSKVSVEANPLRPKEASRPVE